VEEIDGQSFVGGVQKMAQLEKWANPELEDYTGML